MYASKTSQMESVRLEINERLVSVGEEILCVLDKQQQQQGVYSVRVLVLQRLNAVAEFLFSLFQREMETLQTHLLLLLQQRHRNTVLDVHANHSAEVLSEHEEKWSPNVFQEEPQPLQIKQEDDNDVSTLTFLQRTATCLSDSHDGPAEDTTTAGKKREKQSQVDRKRRRMMGQSYVGKSRGAEVHNEPRAMGPPCRSAACVRSAKFYCGEIGEADRQRIFKRYWERMDWEEKKSYVQGLVDVAPVKRRRGASQRSCARVFFLDVGGQRRRVCRSLFLSTLGIKAWSAFSWTVGDGSKPRKNAKAPRDGGVRHSPVCKEGSSPEDDRSSGLLQDRPEPPRIKEEQEELLQGPERVARPMLTLLAVKSAGRDGTDEQTDAAAAGTSNEHTRTQAYVKYWVRSQP